MLTMWWFIALALIGTLVMFFTPNRERTSQSENRILQNKPAFSFSALFNGTYASQFEDFLSDSIPGRNSLIGVSDRLTGFLSMNTSEDAFFLDTTAKEIEEFQQENGISSETSETPDDDQNDSTEPDKALEGDATLELVRKDGGSTLIFAYPKENVEKVSDNLEQFSQLIPDGGHVYLTFVPFPGIAQRLTGNLEYYVGWRSNKLDMIDNLTSDKIVCIDTLKILEPHVLNGKELFLYGDHQWNVHGSYYVYCEMIKAQGLTPTPYDEYEYKIVHPNTGSKEAKKKDIFEYLYPNAPSENYRVYEISKLEIIPFMDYNRANNESYLYGNVHPWKKIVTGYHTGRRALVIGDCFDLSMMPFLLPYYDEVHKTDIRYPKKNLGTTVADMIQRNKIDDVYLIFSEANSVNSQTLRRSLINNVF